MNETASGSEMAALFGISTRTVTDLAASGIFVRVGRGRYDVQASVRNSYHHLREVAAGRGEKATDPLHEQKVRLAKLQADRAEREAEVEAGNLITADEAEREWGGMCALFMRTMMGLPTAIAGVIPHLTRHETTVIEDVVREALNRCADAAQREGDDTAAEAVTPIAGAAP